MSSWWAGRRNSPTAPAPGTAVPVVPVPDWPIGPTLDALRSRPMHRRDVALLFAARSVRMFGYGLLAVVLVLYLDAIGLSGGEIGLLLALTLLGDAAISLWLTTHADRIGRRRVLMVGAVLLLLLGPGVRGHARVHRARSSRRRSASSARAATRSARSWRSSRRRSPSSSSRPRGRACSRDTSSRARSRRRSGRSPRVRSRSCAVDRTGGAERRLPRGDRRLRRHRHRAGGPVLAVSPAVEVPPRRRRGRDDPHPPRPPPLAARRVPPVDAVRARRVRGRLRHAELHRLLVQQKFGVDPGVARRAPVRGQRPRGRVRRSRPGHCRPASGSSARWSSRTCRRTCC